MDSSSSREKQGDWHTEQRAMLSFDLDLDDGNASGSMPSSSFETCLSTRIKMDGRTSRVGAFTIIANVTCLFKCHRQDIAL
jgi:hypothetical protein